VIPTTAAVATRKLPGEGEASQDPEGSVVARGGGVGLISSQLPARSGAVGAPAYLACCLHLTAATAFWVVPVAGDWERVQGLLGRHHHQLVNAPHPHSHRGHSWRAFRPSAVAPRVRS